MDFVQKTQSLLNRQLLCALLLSLAAADIRADVISPSSWVALPQPSDPLFDNLVIPANASTKGMWSGVNAWPLNGLHAIVLPNGKVLTFGSTPNGIFQTGRYYDAWDPALGVGQNSHNTVYDPNRQDSFCSAASYLSDGSLLISGGNGMITGTVYNPSSHSSYSSAANMASSRWYATMIDLPDGRPVILGGMQPYTEDALKSNPDQAIADGSASMTPEIYENGQWRSLFGAYSRLAFGPDYLRVSYPRAWVAPNGLVFGISADQMWSLDVNGNGGNGAITSLGTFKGPYSATAPVNVGATNTAVMFAPGKILQVGGNGGFNADELPGSNMATVIDITSGSPVLSEQPAMTYARRYPNAIVLANGQVVITGGTSYGNNAGGQPATPVYAAEIWDPVTGTWSVGAAAAKLRVYHSITTLLPDGVILSTGGGTPGPVTNLNSEFYYPPYLFESVGGKTQLAARPLITAISGLGYSHGAALQFDMDSEQPISQLALLGLSNATHSFNSGQRRIPLTFTQQRFRVSTALPGNTIAPPGYYQLVALNAAGVPSKGVIVSIGQGQALPPTAVTPYTPPQLDEPIATPTAKPGDVVTYAVASVPGTQYRWRFSDTQTETDFSDSAIITHTYEAPGAYIVTLTARSANGATATRTFVQAVSTSKTARAPRSSSQLALEPRPGGARLWAVNPDNDSVGVMAAAGKVLLAEVAVGASPRSVAVAPNGRIWVTNKSSASIAVIDPETLAVVDTIKLPFASQPHGLVFAPDASAAFVVLEATGKLLKLNPVSGAQLGIAEVGANARHVAVSADSATLLVTRFITPPLPGESTAVVETSNAGGEVLVVDSVSMVSNKTVSLHYSSRVDSETQGSGIPNYLAAPVIAPDGRSAWIASKQDNIKRGVLRSGLPLDFQNSVRAISSRIDMTTLAEDLAHRVDHDNSGVGSAAAFHTNGVYLFVALETSREIAVVNAINGSEMFRVPVGIAPQGVAVADDGLTLFVEDFIGRTVRVIDLRPLIQNGQLTATTSAIVSTVLHEKLAPDVLKGKALFYDASNPKLARDGYLSCASCHNDGGHDGRVWDFTGFGEGLRNTIALNGRAGMGQGALHWSGNFDEVQDFEQQIRDFAGGTGLMADNSYLAGTRSRPLGDKKAGISPELDQLAAYVNSLSRFAPSAYRNADGTLTAAAQAGKAVFFESCARCHSGNSFTSSTVPAALVDIGTINTTTGKRLGQTITGLDIPTLRDVSATAPYLHNGSARTLSDAVRAHNGVQLQAADLANVAAYVEQIGDGDEGKNIASTASLATSYVSGWESLNAVKNGVTPASSADHSTGAYGNWRGLGSFLSAGTTDWVSFSWTTPKVLSALEVYWWSNGLTVTAPVDAYIEYWDGSSWVRLASIGTSLDKYNRTDFAVTTKSIRVSMKGGIATGIIEARVIGFDAPSNALPTVALTAPAANTTRTRGEVVGLDAVASDADGAIAKVEFYAGSTLLYTDTASPYHYDWTVAAVGTYNITAKAYDKVGDVAVSAPVVLTVKAPVNIPPVVTLAKPSVNSLFWVNYVTLNAAATDKDGTISKVEFYSGSTLVSTVYSAPYSYSWRASSGSYTVTAKAYDNSGGSSISGPQTITVP